MTQPYASFRLFPAFAILSLLISFGARAEKAAFIVGSFYYEGEAPSDKCAIISGSDFDGAAFELPGVATLSLKSGSRQIMATSSVLRCYTGCELTLTLAEGIKCEKMCVKCTASNYGEAPVTVNIDDGTVILNLTKQGRGEYIREQYMEAYKSILLTPKSDIYFNYIELTYGPSDLGAILLPDADNDTTAPEYFTPDGRQVSADNLRPGLYICRRGSEITKILLRQ